MAGSINKAILLGRLGGDPEIRVSQDGNKIARLSLATTDNWRDKETNERKEKTEWHRIVIFSKGLAEIAEKYLKKGSLIYVEGQIKSRKFTDQSGMEKYTTEVVLQQYNSSLTMLDNKSDSSSNLESPNIENSIKDENKQDNNSGNFDIEDEVPF
ncbi:MAG: Single-stranded DNA-binding protein [Alphaproteobacteria bacterium MarineAlpha8_Bin1]|nr:MAG: Single-stranded DNA-binding protein [Alphaproteobacteria bacterium MarineAlpha8_Bin1]|tara:strand:- start:315 stop:779 length:465 start_codon:yes stop_codon:yes gene_type:complete